MLALPWSSVIARFRPRPDRRDEFVALLEEVQAASRRDDGCLH
jgi:quinol monooxygenase YgiN